jgi:hypothetical protein
MNFLNLSNIKIVARAIPIEISSVIGLFANTSTAPAIAPMAGAVGRYNDRAIFHFKENRKSKRVVGL